MPPGGLYRFPLENREPAVVLPPLRNDVVQLLGLYLSQSILKYSLDIVEVQIPFLQSHLNRLLQRVRSEVNDIVGARPEVAKRRPFSISTQI